MNNLLVLGCSYSHVGHHMKYAKKENSYTIHIQKQLGFNNLINLAIPGASPSTINRILLQYLDNPIYGRPDFVFIQWPNANRNEYYLDERHLYEDVEYVTDNLKHGLIHFAWAGGKDMVEKYYNNSNWKISNNTWTSTHDGENQKLKSSHERIFANTSQQLINLYKEVGIAENYLGNLKIPYAYIESDYWNGSGLLSQDHYDMPAYNYAQHLCHKQYFIPKMGIQKNSPTYAGANDDYADGHPGPQSHRNFADALVPKLKEIINK